MNFCDFEFKEVGGQNIAKSMDLADKHPTLRLYIVICKRLEIEILVYRHIDVYNLYIDSTRIVAKYFGKVLWFSD